MEFDEQPIFCLSTSVEKVPSFVKADDAKVSINLLVRAKRWAL